MPLTRFDVIIAGAGPAGLATAMRLRRYHLSVGIVDKVDDKRLIVGESVPGAIIRLLKGLEINSMHELLEKSDFSSCSANASAWGTDQWTYTDGIKNPEGGGWHVLRHKFDGALRKVAKQRGVVFLPAKLHSIQLPDRNGNIGIMLKTRSPNVPERIDSQWVVDGTGRASCVLKQLNISRQCFEIQMAAYAWLVQNPDDQDHTTRVKSVTNGWWYTANLPDQSKVISFQGLPDEVARLVKNKDLFISRFNTTSMCAYPIRKEIIKVGIRAMHANISLANQVVGNRWIAVGDAALSFDPISSQGIFFALYSGIKAANTIANAIQKPSDFSPQLNMYEHRVHDVFRANQRMRKLQYTLEQRYAHHPYWKQYMIQ